MSENEPKQRPTERLRLFARWAKENGYVKGENSFESYCGLSNRYITNSLAGGKSGDMTTAIISRVHDRFPMLSLTWLCTGEGDMIIEAPEGEIDYREAYDAAVKQILALRKIIAKYEHL